LWRDVVFSMNIEIERKFLLKDGHFPKEKAGKIFDIKQGYLNNNPNRTIRVRITNSHAYFCVKGRTNNISKMEFEYEIPIDDAEKLLELCVYPPIIKKRYKIPFEGHIFEVDVFEGVNKGLVVVEVELRSEDEQVSLPDWVGKEVTGDPWYYNSHIAVCPYKDWK